MPVDPLGYSAVPIAFNVGRQIRDAESHPLALVTPLGSAGSTEDRNSPSLGFAVRVPIVAERDLLRIPHLAVRFRNLRQGSHSKGVHLADLFRPACEGATLSGAKDAVLVGYGGPRRELKFRINWPGYESEQTTIRSVSDNGGTLTRLELARNIMYVYGKFFRKVVAKRIRPSQVGPYNIALDQSEDATGPDSVGIKLAELHLVKFREPVPGDNHWVAEIDIVRVEV